MPLEAQNLSGGYGTTTIVEAIDLALAQGEWLSLLGANGSGKSTLLRLMSRILAPQQGVVLLDGKTIHSQPMQAVARQLAILPQQQTVPPGLTVEQLVSLGRAPYQNWRAVGFCATCQPQARRMPPPLRVKYDPMRGPKRSTRRLSHRHPMHVRWRILIRPPLPSGRLRRLSAKGASKHWAAQSFRWAILRDRGSGLKRRSSRRRALDACCSRTRANRHRWI